MDFEILETEETKSNPKYEITGDDCQVLTTVLDPSETLKTEPGTMLFMDRQIKSDCNYEGCGRVCAGETCYSITYTNSGNDQAYLGLTPDLPAKVVPIDLAAMGTAFICQSGSYMCSVGDVNVSFNCDCNIGRCLCAGVGATRQKLTGAGTAFLVAGGTILQKQLGENERILVDSESLVGWQESAQLGYKCTGGMGTCCFGGEGCFNTTIKGPGLVIIQSMAFPKLLRAVRPPAQGGAGGPDGAGGAGGD